MLPLYVRVDLGAMAMKGYSTFPKDPGHLLGGYGCGVSYSTAEMQSVYSTVPANWAGNHLLMENIPHLTRAIPVQRRKLAWQRLLIDIHIYIYILCVLGLQQLFSQTSIVE